MVALPWVPSPACAAIDNTDGNTAESQEQQSDDDKLRLQQSVHLFRA